MLKRQKIKKDNTVKVTFVLPGDMPETSVVGDFNEWDPASHPLKRRSNGTRSAAVVLEPGKEYEFRYFDPESKKWFNEAEADDYAPSSHGSQNCVLKT